MSKILISTGDHSADIYGESLVKEMKKIDPSLHVTALGGTRLKGVADLFLRDMVKLDISGFTQPIKQFFNLKNILQKTVFPVIKRSELDAVILIDYYGFNIHIAEKAKENNVPVFYFVSPQVWASRQWRIEKLKNSVTKMLVIFPFEEELYKKHGVPVEFVGHPFVDAVARLNLERKKFNGTISEGPIRMGLMPGSRKRELIRHVPLMIDCLKILKEKFPNIEGSLFAADSIPDDYYRTFRGIESVKIIRENDFRKRSELTLCLTASGTATLENTLLGIPMVVIYQTSWLTYFVVKNVIRIPFVSMPNILSGKEVVTELIQHRANQKSVIRAASHLISKPGELEKMYNELVELKNSLGQPGACVRAAKIILEAIR